MCHRTLALLRSNQPLMRFELLFTVECAICQTAANRYCDCGLGCGGKQRQLLVMRYSFVILYVTWMSPTVFMHTAGGTVSVSFRPRLQFVFGCWDYMNTSRT